MKYIANCSFGKDSLAMVLFLIENKLPLDEVVFYDTGMEFEAIYRNRDKMLPILKQHGIKYTELKPETNFIYDMLERPVKSKQKGEHKGYGWCGGVCRWGTTRKTKALDDYAKGAKIQYIGIAADEPERVERLKDTKCAPLAQARMTEKDCLKYCRLRGWNWNEPSPITESGYIDLYDILDRVSCWCCSNKNRRELKNIYKYLPLYWERLKHLQSQLSRPMKKFNCRAYGEYGNVFDMETVFRSEESQIRLSKLNNEIRKENL